MAASFMDLLMGPARHNPAIAQQQVNQMMGAPQQGGGGGGRMGAGQIVPGGRYNDVNLNQANNMGYWNLQQQLAGNQGTNYGWDAQQNIANTNAGPAYYNSLAQLLGTQAGANASMYGADAGLMSNMFRSLGDQNIAGIQGQYDLAGTQYQSDAQRDIADTQGRYDLQGTQYQSDAQRDIANITGQYGLEGTQYQSDAQRAIADRMATERELGHRLGLQGEQDVARMGLQGSLANTAANRYASQLGYQGQLADVQGRRDVAGIQGRTALGVAGTQADASRYGSLQQREAMDLATQLRLQGQLADVQGQQNIAGIQGRTAQNVAGTQAGAAMFGSREAADAQRAAAMYGMQGQLGVADRGLQGQMAGYGMQERLGNRQLGLGEQQLANQFATSNRGYDLAESALGNIFGGGIGSLLGGGGQGGGGAQQGGGQISPYNSVFDRGFLPMTSQIQPPSYAGRKSKPSTHMDTVARGYGQQAMNDWQQQNAQVDIQQALARGQAADQANLQVAGNNMRRAQPMLGFAGGVIGNAMRV